MVTESATAATDWLTELDSIDTTWNITAFNHSYLGRLSVELLQGIVQYIPAHLIPAVARTSSGLREVAERQLYTCINLSKRADVVSGGKDVLWPLHCTLARRPDLAQKVKKFSATLYDRDVRVEIDTSALFPDDVHFSSAAKVSLHEMVVVGRILLQQLINVEAVSLVLNFSPPKTVTWGVETTACELLTPQPISKLLPEFECTSAHQLLLFGLRKLNFLKFAGAEFHWIFARSPYLRKIDLTRACIILPDRAPDEVNTNVRSLSIPARSTILDANSLQYGALMPFLAHFPSLEHLRLTICDLDIDFLHLSTRGLEEPGEKSYATLLKRFNPVAPCLTSLDIGLYDPGDDDASVFLRRVQPASGFKEFKALKRLVVPYQCLLGATVSLVDTLPSPATILPSTLESLEVYCPRIHIYDWFLRLRNVRHRLLVLSKIMLHCHSVYGDSYDQFAFINCLHPVLDVVDELGITLDFSYRARDWEEDWNDYDLEIFAVLDWLETLGA